MTTNIIPFPLADGPLCAPTPDYHPHLVLEMAAILLETDSFRDHRAAFLALVLRGFRSFDVAVLIDDARQYAMQALIAAEMSEDGL